MTRRYANRRDANEKEIVAALEAIGCDVIRMHAPVDLLVGYRNKTLLLEVKTPKGSLTSDQEKFFKSWRGHKAVVSSIDEAIDAVTNPR